MIDWELAERVAGAVAGAPNGETTRPLPGDLDAMAADARRHVTAYARLAARQPADDARDARPAALEDGERR